MSCSELPLGSVPGRFLGFCRLGQELMELAHYLIERSRSSGIEIPSGWKLGSEFLEEFPEFVIEKHKFQGQMASTLSMPSTSSTMSTLSTRDMKLQ